MALARGQVNLGGVLRCCGFRRRHADAWQVVPEGHTPTGHRARYRTHFPPPVWQGRPPQLTREQPERPRRKRGAQPPPGAGRCDRASFLL